MHVLKEKYLTEVDGSDFQLHFGLIIFEIIAAD